MTAVLAVGIAYGALVMLALGAPSRHRFDPRPDKPSECRRCGRRRTAHPDAT